MKETPTSVSTTSKPSLPASKTATPDATSSEPTKDDYGGIDPDLAYLDPSLKARRPGGANAGNVYAARFNARTGRFEGDPNRNPDYVSDVSRAKRQNNFYCMSNSAMSRLHYRLSSNAFDIAIY